MRAMLFILLNVIVTAIVVYVVINFDLFGTEQTEAIPRFATVEVIVTATQDPNATPLVRVITATPDANQIASLPTGVFDITPGAGGFNTASGGAGAISTIDPTLLASDSNLQAALGGSVLPDGCLLHTLEEGEAPGALAVRYNASLERILLVNGLDDTTARFLQIGQTLIIPLEGCPLEAVTADDDPDATPTPDPDATPEEEPTVTPTPTPTPTITLAPTAVNAEVQIQEVIGRGDITAEAVILYNSGRAVDITGWTLRDLDGNEYTFSEQRLFNDSSIEVFTRQGNNTPVRKFWGLSDAVWGESGDVVILSNAEGVVQSILRLSAPVDLE